jgi:muramoyltetrapeptide carboxypeptidase
LADNRSGNPFLASIKLAPVSAQSRRWPAPLRPGDVVNVVAPGGPYEPSRLDQGADILRSWGLTVRFTEPAAGADHRLSYLSADDQSRADGLVNAWCDPDCCAVWAVRGGYGSQRMVDRLDMEALRAAGPRHLVGFSDITALHGRIGRQLDQITIHGPGIGSVEQLRDRSSAEALQRLIMTEALPGLVLASGQTFSPGEATGRLWGGNLSLLASEVGIEPAPDEPSVLIIEDVGEESYRIDRMLTQLARAGWLDHVVGVGVGQFSGNPTPHLLEHVLGDRLAGLGVPVICGLQVGHGSRNVALPLGAQVSISA